MQAGRPPAGYMGPPVQVQPDSRPALPVAQPPVQVPPPQGFGGMGAYQPQDAGIPLRKMRPTGAYSVSGGANAPDAGGFSGAMQPTSPSRWGGQSQFGYGA